MHKLLITLHMHILALIIGVIIIPLVVAAVRKRMNKTAFTSEENNKLRLDVAILIPVGALLWNLSLYYLDNIYTTPPFSLADANAQAVKPVSVALATISFEQAVAAAGESTVALATAIIFCRMFGAIWADLKK